MPADENDRSRSLPNTIRHVLTSGNPRLLLWAIREARQTLTARFYLRGCTRVGAFTRVSGHRPHISNKGTLVIGDRVRIRASLLPIELATMPGATLVIGERTFLNYGVSIVAHESISIGHRCLIGPYVNIQDNDWHDILDRSHTPASKPVIIEDDVWLGTRVIVLPGVTIGHDAVVGAGAVVSRSIPPRSIAVGNPARVLRTF